MNLAVLVNDVLTVPKNSCTVSEYHRFLNGLVLHLQPKNILELGTGEGWSAMHMLEALPEDGRLTTINLPNPPCPDDVGKALDSFSADARLTRLLGDTRDPAVAARVPDGIDFMLIDSTHNNSCASVEWAMYRNKLTDGAIVCMDDLFHNDLMAFWNWLPYDKILIESINTTGFGIFAFAMDK